MSILELVWPLYVYWSWFNAGRYLVGSPSDCGQRSCSRLGLLLELALCWCIVWNRFRTCGCIFLDPAMVALLESRSNKLIGFRYRLRFIIGPRLVSLLFLAFAKLSIWNQPSLGESTGFGPGLRVDWNRFSPGVCPGCGPALLSLLELVHSRLALECQTVWYISWNQWNQNSVGVKWSFSNA